MSRHLDVMTMRHEKQQESQCAQPAKPAKCTGRTIEPQKWQRAFLLLPLG